MDPRSFSRSPFDKLIAFLPSAGKPMRWQVLRCRLHPSSPWLAYTDSGVHCPISTGAQSDRDAETPLLLLQFLLTQQKFLSLRRTRKGKKAALPSVQSAGIDRQPGIPAGFIEGNVPVQTSQICHGRTAGNITDNARNETDRLLRDHPHPKQAGAFRRTRQTV